MSRGSGSWRSTWRRTPEPCGREPSPPHVPRCCLALWSALCSWAMAPCPASWCVFRGWTPWLPSAPPRLCSVCCELCPISPTLLDLDSRLDEPWPPGELPISPQAPRPQGGRALVLRQGSQLGALPPGDVGGGGQSHPVSEWLAVLLASVGRGWKCGLTSCHEPSSQHRIVHP